MAMETRFSVRSEDAFPHGVYAFSATQVKPARDFEKSTRDSEVQMRDRDTGIPVWTFDVLDADPNAQGKNAAITVRIVSQFKPTLPEAPAGLPFRPVQFEGLTASPYVDQRSCTGNGRCRARLAWSFRATGIRAPEPKGAAPGRVSQAANGEVA